MAEAERRKTLEKELDIAKQKANYTDQLDRRRQEEMISAQRRMHDDRLRHEEESIQRQEHMRRETLKYESKLRLEQEQARIEAQRRADAKNERETHDLIKERLRIKESERRTTIKEIVLQNSIFFQNSVIEFFSSPISVGKFVAFSTVLWGSYQMSKQSALLFKWWWMLKLQKPPLVRETSINTSLYKRFLASFQKDKPFDI